MELEVARRVVERVAGTVAAALVLICIIGGQSAFAAVTKEFNALLSLTGDCTASSLSSLDSVLDPGCPQKHPSRAFANPQAVSTDFYGDIYVANTGKAESGSEGQIDVFNPAGVFITEIPHPKGPVSIAVDSKGTLYVVNHAASTEKLVRYDATVYEPAAEKIKYSDPPIIIEHKARASLWVGLAVDVKTDHLFANFGGEVVEYDTAANNNQVVEAEIGGAPSASGSLGLAIDAERERIYEANQSGSEGAVTNVQVLELTFPHEPLGTIEGTAVPADEFVGPLSVAVDEGSGDVFVLDGGASKLYQFSDTFEYMGTIEHGFQVSIGNEITVDNGPFSPNGVLNEKGRYVYVPSHSKGIGHSFAFGPIGAKCPPVVESTSLGGISETEAELQATVNPCNLPTTYRFEYTTKQRFEEEDFENASVAGGGSLPPGSVGAVSATAGELLPATGYRFRVVVTNKKGAAEAGGQFSTYPTMPIAPCPNDDRRTGFSALLPDCRAYELVTPASTNGRPPRGASTIGMIFETPQASPAGDKVPFLIQGGAIPGTGGTGGGIALAGDPYLASRGSSGWGTTYTGASGVEASSTVPGGTSADQDYSFYQATGAGSALIQGRNTNYVRYPGGAIAPVGRGSLGIDPEATGRLISPNGSHIIFEAEPKAEAFRLEPKAPLPYQKVVNEKEVTVSTRAIYDRTSDEVTHVVSLLPGGAPPAPGEDAEYVGASTDGRGIAFAIGSTLYLRFDNSETYKIGEGVTFAGVAEGGNRVFYLKGGKLWRLDVIAGDRLAFNESGTAIPVNVSADGTTAYLVSTSVLTEAANPQGAKAKAGEQNLYLSREGSISFVGILTERDVVGEEIAGVEPIDGVGLWVAGVGRNAYGNAGRLAEDPSRSTADGRVLIFQARAALTEFDSNGHVEIYRYDSAEGKLECLSCDPTGVTATGQASLQTFSGEGGLQVLSSYSVVSNLSASGQRAVFQSTEALVASDTDERQDVYEWEAGGVGSCTRTDGCLYLITSGQSARDDYLFAASKSGDDVFFLSSDLLLSQDSDETPSIYDARVGGGFPEPEEAECQGEGCRPDLTQAPLLPSGRTPVLGKGDNIVRYCPRGKRKAKRHGKVRCIKKRHKHRHKPSSKRRGAAK